MPVYLCQPGAGAAEPWRHGIQVYATPFAMDDGSTPNAAEDPALAPTTTSGTGSDSGENRDVQTSTTRMAGNDEMNTQLAAGVQIRRVRHAEVVLVDDVCIAYDRYWLRLRWPGGKGGFAGYIALGKVGQSSLKHELLNLSAGARVEGNETSSVQGEDDYVAIHSVAEEERATANDVDKDDQMREDEPADNASTRSSDPSDSMSTLTCMRTRIQFPSSVAMKLMAVYDDGLNPPVVSGPLPTEPVFCRICREGLHDDADDEQPSPAMENDADDGMNRGSSRSPGVSSNNLDGGGASDAADDLDDNEPAVSEPLSKGPVQPHPTYHPNPHAAENPMLAPCECSGSMAFVHYLCVEQWRCRSRHPEARQGLQCETCSQPYALPPPSARPANVLQVENEDWLEAMPPHVMAALRQPHIWWQIGAAIVRRRWLRPLAPVFMSPIVALYCRARRLLKKKGVARRRWACSLCRRRARWKCVRCLRSYYCSRQCQNVSWHIVHKHVCYKPSRWAWSVVVYGIATLFLFPGILRDPLMYDMGLGFVPVSFYVMAVLGGGIATTLKKSFGVDLRGRTFEMVVILLTVWLVFVSWGLVGAFFGDPSKCRGVLGSTIVSNDNISYLLKAIKSCILEPAEIWFLMWDRLAMNSGSWLRKTICTEQEYGCFEHLHNANSEFLFEEHGGEYCASDLSLVVWLYLSSVFVAAGSHFWKQRERQRRAARRPVREPRPHQD